MSDRDPSLTTTSLIPSPLLWALMASTVVHTAFVVLPHASLSHGKRTVAENGALLQAALVAPAEQKPDLPADQQAELMAAAASPTQNLPAQDFAVRPDLHAIPAISANAVPTSAPPETVAVGGLGEKQVDGQLLEDRNRLGDLLTRQLTEFPVEVDFPVRLKEIIRARYPAAALAAGREDSVAVWVVVDSQGTAEEILVVDGAPEFADAVVAAVKEIRFQPARNNLLAIRFPIALEFHFGNGAAAVTAATAIAR